MSDDNFEEFEPGAQESGSSHSQSRRFQLEDDLDPHERFDIEEGGRGLGMSEVVLDEIPGDEDELEEEEVVEPIEFEGARNARGFQRDTFEQWASLSKKYEILEHDELDRLASLVSSEDSEVSEYAVQKLVRHNIRWILSCANKYASRGVMSRSGELRNEVLAEARMGFVIGLHKYDEDKAVSGGATSHRKSLLKYTEFWIRKRVGALLKKEHFGLNVDAALDRDKVVRGEKVMKERLGRKPTDDEVHAYLEEDARKRLAEEGNTEPELSQLRKKGALTLDRVKSLRRHQTENISLDTGATQDDDAPSLGDYVANTDRTPDELAEMSDMQRRVTALLNKVAHGRLSRMTVSMSHGMSNESGTERYEPFNDDELGFIHGATRDTVRTRRSEIEAQLRGEVEVSVEDLIGPDAGLSRREFLATFPSPEAQIEEVDSRLSESQVLEYYEVSEASELPCVEGECGGVLETQGSEVACSSCGVKHDVLGLIRSASHMFGDEGASREQALDEASWLLSGVKWQHREAADSNRKVAAMSNPGLNKKLRRLI